MVWRFRKTFSPAPGVRVTLSPRGLTTSVGIGPLRIRSGPRRTAFTTTPFGTLSFHPSSGRPGEPREEVAPALASRPGVPGSIPPSDVPPRAAPPLEEIKSAGSAGLTTPGLEAFRRLLEQANKDHALIVSDLNESRRHENAAVAQLRRWEQGWLLRRIFVSKFRQLGATAQEMKEKREELQQQERLARVQTHIELPDGVKAAFHLLSDEFDRLARSRKIWDTVGQRATDRIAERTTAARLITRKPVNFRLGSCEVIDFGSKIPHLENANGGDLFFYPAFVLYFVTSTSFALLEYKEVELTLAESLFIEEEAIPSDAKVVGHTWAKTNKDGSPDKRFKDNHQIPVARYAKLVFRSTTGMNEEYMASNAEQAEAFAIAWKRMVEAVANGV